MSANCAGDHLPFLCLFCGAVCIALQLLVQGLAEQLVRLPVRFDDDTDVPLWADSAADYKDAVGQFRSQVRNSNHS
jgi:hypothetical protein